MDEFAQSREDDDLFADEFEPVTAPSFTIDETPVPLAAEEKPANVPSNGANPSSQRNGRKEGQERRQRGGRGGGGANNGLNASRYAPKTETAPAQAPAPESAAPPTTISTSEPAIPPPSTSNSAPASQNDEPKPAEPTPAIQPTNTRTPAVRGDRSATGGPAHKKLTEEELTLKLEKMAILNAQKAERHRLSEADQAAFQHREKELAKERREKAVAEKRNERVMEMERAKNRERKMKAQGGREWDSEKVESDIVDGRGRGRSSEFVRGGHGGVIRGRGGGLAGSRYATEEWMRHQLLRHNQAEAEVPLIFEVGEEEVEVDEEERHQMQQYQAQRTFHLFQLLPKLLHSSRHPSITPILLLHLQHLRKHLNRRRWSRRSKSSPRINLPVIGRRKWLLRSRRRKRRFDMSCIQ